MTPVICRYTCYRLIIQKLKLIDHGIVKDLVTSCWQSSLSSASLDCLSLSLFLPVFLDLLYYLCPAPLPAQSSQVSPVEPDDKLRLLLRPATRNSSNACKHTYTYTLAVRHTHTHTRMHTHRHPICPSLFSPSHIYSHTQLLSHTPRRATWAECCVEWGNVL